MREANLSFSASHTAKHCSTDKTRRTRAKSSLDSIMVGNLSFMVSYTGMHCSSDNWLRTFIKSWLLLNADHLRKKTLEIHRDRIKIQ